MSKIGILKELDLDEKIRHESPICDLEFDKQEDTIRQLFGEKIKGRVICKTYLTNKRILMLLLIIPDKKDMEPKSNWYSLPYEKLINIEHGKKRRHYNKMSLELEFIDFFVDESLTGTEENMKEKGKLRGWISRRGKEKTKLWLYVPNSQIWNIKLKEILQEKRLV